MRPLLLALVSLPAFAQVVPARSFYDLPSSNGHSALMVDGRTGKLVHFREHLPATEEFELDAMGNEAWVGNQPQIIHTRDLLFDAYFGLRVGAQQRWLDATQIVSSGYAPGSGVITTTQNALGLSLTTSIFSPRTFPHASYVAILCARNTGANALNDVSLFHLENLHLGTGRPGVRQELDSENETIVITNGDVFERGFAGVVGTRALGASTVAAWNPNSAANENAYLVVRDTTNAITPRAGDLGVANDWASAFQFNLGTIAAGSEACAGVVSAHHADPFAQSEVTAWLDAWVAGRGARAVLDAELAHWAAFQASLTLPPNLTPEEQSVTRQGAATMAMAQVQSGEAFLREWRTRDGELRSTRFETLDGGALPNIVRHRGKGAVLASLPPGEWTYSWVRDGAYAVVALAELGLVTEAREGLRFFLDAEGGRFKDWTEFQPQGFPPYVLSLTRYVGFGVEETDFNDFGPNLEFDGFGLVLWALHEHEVRTQDTSLVDARWSDIATLIADPLVALIEPSTGLLRKDSSIWETHWKGRERTWAFTNITAARGLCDAALLAQRMNDPARAMKYRVAGQALRRAIGEKFTDARGALASNREELVSGGGYYDAAVFDALAMGLFAPDGRIARATLDAMDRELKVANGPGWARNDDFRDHSGATDLSPWGGHYDSAEWVITDMRGTMAMRAAGRVSRADAVLDFTRRQSARNAGVFSETYEETTGAYKFNAPMIGFGAGAWVLALAHREGRAIEPACGVYEEPAAPDAGVELPDAGVVVPDAGTTVDAGSMAPMPPPNGCGCSSAGGVFAVVALLLARRRRC